MLYGRLGAVLLAVSLLGATACAAETTQKWVYAEADLCQTREVDQLVLTMQEARKLGCTHALVADRHPNLAGDPPESFLANVSTVRDAAAELDITLVPAVFPFGSSTGYAAIDPDLAAALPVGKAPFVVSGGVAWPDASSAPSVANPGFEDQEETLAAGWSADFPGKHTFVDTETFHSGAASLRMSNLDALPPEAGGVCKVSQTLSVRPFQHYRLTVWVKTPSPEAQEAYVLLTSGEGRRHSYGTVPLSGTTDWREHQVVFNALDASKLELSLVVGNTGGDIWWDDLKLEPAGLGNLLRSPAKPFRVTNADESVVYIEGEDFETVSDPLAGMAHEGEAEAGRFVFDAWHKGPGIVITPGSRISEGGVLLVSYYHAHVSPGGHVETSLSEEKAFELMDAEMKRAAELWGASGYLMNYRDIRIGGWEASDSAESPAPGEILAAHVTRAVEIARRHAPDAALYTWSDMFDPHDGARPFEKEGPHYLANGNWGGSWKGLPAEVVVVTRKVEPGTVQWFADRGHSQILAIDGTTADGEALRALLDAAKDVPNVLGMMYMSPDLNVRQMEEVFAWLAKTWKGEDVNGPAETSQ